MERRQAVGLAIALQLLILIGIAGAMEWRLSVAAVVLLETEPADLRDLFRGDYVILNYPISRLDSRALGAQETFSPGQTVYVGLTQRGAYWQARSVRSFQTLRPFLRGKVRVVSGDVVIVDYGIGTYYVPRQTLRTIKSTSDRLAVEVAVARDGTPVIRRVLLRDRPLR